MVKKRSAFTLIELVMVIVVLGIIASIGADIIASMYQNYLRTRTINRLQAQSEITLEQIAKRLQYRIKDSTIARNINVGAANPLLPLSDSRVDENYNVIEWIGMSNETFRGTGDPLWTGLIDLEDANTSSTAVPPTVVSPGSNFPNVAALMRALTDNNVTMDTNPHAALIFIRTHGTTPAEFGWGVGVGNNSDGNNSLPVQTTPGQQDTLQIVPNAGTLPTEISEHYYLAHTAYALAPVYENPAAPNRTDFNLTLYYNYQPWRSHDYLTHGTSSVLAEHVQLFRVRQDANLIRLKLCLHDDNTTGTGDRIVTCKEKVVF
jgi:prepilin-type N-terminal cleavage/methylation domain-containing protein